MCNKFFFSFSAVDKKKLFRLFFFHILSSIIFDTFLSLSLNWEETRFFVSFCHVSIFGEKKNRKILVVNCLNSKYHFRSKDTHTHAFQWILLYFFFRAKIYFYEDYVCDFELESLCENNYGFHIFGVFFFRRKCGNEYTLTQKYRKRKKQIHPVLFPLGLSSTMNGWMNEWNCSYKTSEMKQFFSSAYFTVFCLMAYLHCWSRKKNCVYVIPWQSFMVCASVYLIKV